ncbi:MAG: hypothetical protein AAFP20_10375 [Cyanobacteria bacterium J06614_10]
MNAAQRPASPDYTDTFYSPRQPSAHPTGTSEPARQNTSLSEQPAAPRPAYRPKRSPHTGARQAIAFESSVKLTVNLLLAIVATTTIAKLVPYYQQQQQRLTTLQSSIEVAEQKNAKLREDFTHNFDPAQAGRIMQEQSGMAYPNQKKVIWTEPIDSSN